MKFHKKLYWGEAAHNNKSQIILDLRKRKLCPGVYLITFSDSEGNLFDIIPWFMMFKDDNYKREYIGIAFTKEEAFNLVGQIIDDIYKETNSFDARGYFE